MEPVKKIPDDVFENRCRWCIHGRVENGNKEIPERHLFVEFHHRTFPCNIMGISRCDKVPGECLSFQPNYIYGVCGTCNYSSMFGDDFCHHPNGPANKRIVYLGDDFTKDGYWTHRRSTCDRYLVDPRCQKWIMKAVLEGKSPANFDPDTWEPLAELTGTPQAAEWLRLQEQAKAEREKVTAERKEKRDSEAVEQLSMFD